MAVDLNNATFRLFTDFATQAKSLNARAQLQTSNTVELGGTVRTIKAANNYDFIGNVFRLSRYKTANDQVRELFRDTIVEMFHGADRVPENVREAMKLEDYECGKPLTARRITEVKRAIDDFVQTCRNDAESAIDKLFNVDRTQLNNRPQEDIESLKNTIRGIFESCESADARDVMKDCIVSICLRGDDTIRTADDIKAKADAIKSNFKELQAAAKGNQQILKAGKFLISSLNGKSLPPGQIRALTEFATGAEVQLDVVRRLKSSTGPVTIAKALIQLEKNIKNALDSNGIKFGSFDAEIANPTSDFIARVVLQRLGPSKLRNVQRALTGGSVAQLAYLAKRVVSFGLGEIPVRKEALQEAIMDDPQKDIPKDLGDGIKEMLGALAGQKLDTMSAIIGEILDETPPNTPRTDQFPVNTLMILSEVKDFEMEKFETRKSEFQNKTVEGDGQKAELMRDLIASKMGEYCIDPENTVCGDIADKTMENLSGKFSSEMQKIVGGGDGTSGLKTFSEITLGGKVLPGDVGKAKDGIAEFVTGGKIKDFASLQGPDLRKAQMLLALISPESQKSLAEGFLAGLDNDRANELFDINSLTPQNLAAAGAKVNVTMDKSGKLTITLDNTIRVEERPMAKGQILSDPNDKYSAKLNLGFKLQILPEEFERLAKADDFKFDLDNVRLSSNFKASFLDNYSSTIPKAILTARAGLMSTFYSDLEKICENNPLKNIKGYMNACQSFVKNSIKFTALAERYVYEGIEPKFNLADHVAKFEKLTSDILQSVGDDEDLKKLILENFDKIVFDGKHALRSVEKVQKNYIAALKANLTELKELEKTTPGIYKLGIETLLANESKAYNNGMFGRLVAAAKKMPLADLAALKPDSPPNQMLPVFIEILRALEGAVDAGDVKNAFDRGDRTVRDNFCVRAALLMLPKASREGLTNLLRGQNAGSLSRHMQLFSSYCSDYNRHVLRPGLGDKDGKLPDFLENFFAKGADETARIRTKMQNVQQAVAMVTQVLAQEIGENAETWSFNIPRNETYGDLATVPKELLRMMMEA